MGRSSTTLSENRSGCLARISSRGLGKLLATVWSARTPAAVLFEVLILITLFNVLGNVRRPYLINSSSQSCRGVEWLFMHNARKQPHDIARVVARCQLGYSLLRNLQRVVHLDAEISDCA